MRIKFDPHGEGGGSNEAPASGFDPIQFKQEMISSTQQMIEQATAGFKASMEGIMNGLKTPPKIEAPISNSISVGDFTEENQELGLDEKQLDALIRIMNKQMQKNSPKFKEEVLNDVDNSMTHKELRQQYENSIKMKYPAVVNQKSELFQQASIIYKNMTENQKQFPDAMANAVLQAAANLGIPPLSINEINAQQAQDFRGDPPAGKRKENGPSEAGLDFAQSFGIKPDHFKAKLKFTQAKH